MLLITISKEDALKISSLILGECFRIQSINFIWESGSRKENISLTILSFIILSSSKFDICLVSVILHDKLII